MKKILFLLLLLLSTIIPLTSHATTDLKTRNEVFEFLKEAFEAQVSLSEKGRSIENIKEVLNPYFSDEYQNEFWKENVHNENGKYVTYGSDYAKYYIPFYHFSSNTKVVNTLDKIYIFEYFPQNMEGPVGFSSHYEGLLIKKIDGIWKIDKYLYNDLPKDIIEKGAETHK